ncbi:hypothetical protein HDU96_004779 [Phlyctochytrium bullatum]|nr:hypothetical protein HDU96_004779 [Phlyctochytrium bullatum]
MAKVIYGGVNGIELHLPAQALPKWIGEGCPVPLPEDLTLLTGPAAISLIFKLGGFAGAIPQSHVVGIGVGVGVYNVMAAVAVGNGLLLPGIGLVFAIGAAIKYDDEAAVGARSLLLENLVWIHPNAERRRRAEAALDFMADTSRYRVRKYISGVNDSFKIRTCYIEFSEPCTQLATVASVEDGTIAAPAKICDCDPDYMTRPVMLVLTSRNGKMMKVVRLDDTAAANDVCIGARKFVNEFDARFAFLANMPAGHNGKLLSERKIFRDSE